MADPGVITKIIFFLIIVFSSILNSVTTAPADLHKENLKNCSDCENNNNNNNNSQEEYEIIDQRQNGTENYRINVKDVVVIWAPADSLLAATALLDAQILGADYNFETENQKPQSGEKPEIIVELVGDKPSGQNSTTAANSNKVGTTELPVNSNSDNTAEERSFRSEYQYLGNLGPLLRRTMQKQ